jgi:putative tricarboxylic transport membrane protein
MWHQRLWMAAPYTILVVLAGWLYLIAGTIEFVPQGDNLGPDFWPRTVLVAMMAICAVQAARILFFADTDEEPAADDTAHTDEAEEADAPRSHVLLASGLALTVAYGALLTLLGFLTATALYLVLFMYIGRYRAHLAIWISSVAGAALLTLVFQKVVYVSLPRGVFPFDLVTDALLRLF